MTCASRESNRVPPDSRSEDHPTRLFRSQNFASLKISYVSKIENVCGRARRGFFRAQNSDFVFFNTENCAFLIINTEMKVSSLIGGGPPPPMRDRILVDFRRSWGGYPRIDTILEGHRHQYGVGPPMRDRSLWGFRRKKKYWEWEA